MAKFLINDAQVTFEDVSEGNKIMTTTQHKHYETARRAYTWMSFNPEKRAISECAYFDDICAEFADRPEVLAKFERFFLLSLAAKSRCASSMITGPARFPVEKQRRASEREHKISGEMLAYIDRVRKAIAQEAYYTAHPEARPISSDDSDALDKLKEKLAKLEKLQETMVQANKLVRKGDIAALAVLLGSEEAAQTLIKPDYCGRTGFASFELTNNNAKIKQVKERIATLEKRQGLESKEVVINGIKIVQNVEANRLQLFFEGKPALEVIAHLKKHGFKWAPSVMAWQRQLTANAIYSFNHFLLPALKELNRISA